MKLIGARLVDYQRKDGSNVHGMEICVSRPMEDGVGDTADSYFISGLYVNVKDIKLGEIMTLLFVPGFNGRQRCTGLIYKDGTLLSV